MERAKNKRKKECNEINIILLKIKSLHWIPNDKAVLQAGNEGEI